jgi:hypothetical protein
MTLLSNVTVPPYAPSNLKFCLELYVWKICKVSSHTIHLWRRRVERMCSSYSFAISALSGGEWSASRPGRTLAPGKDPPAPIGQEAGCAPEPVWTQRLEEKSSCLCRGSNLDRPVVQSVARHYTDWATPAHLKICNNNNNVRSSIRNTGCLQIFSSLLGSWR